VDEFLSEKEQLEQIRDWWKEYGWYLLGGAALGGVLLFGWTRYQSYEQQQVETASALYDELFGAVADRADVRATELLAEIRTDYEYRRRGARSRCPPEARSIVPVPRAVR
jgi:predicted negative regulator of RcsB-dependent stress response